MEYSLPAWFQADEVFDHEGYWYLGSLGSLHIGPYSNRETAETKSVQVTKELCEMSNGGNQLRYVRKLLHTEWNEIGMTNSDGERCLSEEIELTPPPSPVRRGEAAKNWFRSERFVKVSGVWFFTTREGIDVGPFFSELEAKKHEQQLVAMLKKSKSEQEALRMVYEYKHRPPL